MGSPLENKIVRVAKPKADNIVVGPYRGGIRVDSRRRVGPQWALAVPLRARRDAVLLRGRVCDIPLRGCAQLFVPHRLGREFWIGL